MPDGITEYLLIRSESKRLCRVIQEVSNAGWENAKLLQRPFKDCSLYTQVRQNVSIVKMWNLLLLNSKKLKL